MVSLGCKYELFTSVKLLFSAIDLQNGRLTGY